MADLKLRVFRKGDIVRNIYAGDGNPQRYLMYVGKGTVFGSKSYDCIAYDGKKVQFYQADDPLEVVGHMDEFDSFIAALKRLKNLGQEG